MSYAASGGTDPFSGFTAFDRNLVPFHTGSGPWGAQRTITPAPRATGGTVVNVATPSEFEVAARTANRTVRLTANIDSPVLNGGDDITNLIVDLNGFVLSRPAFLLPSNVTTNRRILFVNGSTRGSFSGGQLHQPLLGGNYDSIVLDGIGLTGSGLTGGDSTNAITINGSEFVNYFEVIACRVNSGAAGFLIGNYANATFLGNSIQTGLLDAPPGDEAWGMRFGIERACNTVIAYNEVRGRRFHKVRLAPKAASLAAYAWIGYNRFVDQGEGKLLWVDAFAGGGVTATHQMAAVWLTNNTNDLNGTLNSIESNDADYFYHLNSIYYGNYSAGNVLINNEILETTSGVSYNAFRTIPAWGAAGDPSALDWNNWES